MSTDRRSIVVVDDHSLFRSGVVQAFREVDDFSVVGEGASAADAIDLVERLAPDIALADVSMPGGGLDAAQTICKRWPKVKVIMLTVSEDQETILKALDAGSVGYVLKGVSASDLVNIVRSIADGERYVPPSMAVQLLTAMRKPQAVDPVQARLALLSRAEARVLRLLAHGLSNREIAQATGVQVKTVKFHVSNILSKGGFKNRTEAAVVAQKYVPADD